MSWQVYITMSLLTGLIIWRVDKRVRQEGLWLVVLFALAWPLYYALYLIGALGVLVVILLGRCANRRLAAGRQKER